jgi:hypothetical protein
MATKEWDEIDGHTKEFPIYYCAFLDVLGYKQKSELYFKNQFNLPERIERAFVTVSTTQLFTSILVDTSTITIESFSDSIIILQPADKRGIGGLLLFASFFTSNLSFEDLLVRGGVSMGKHSDYKTVTGFRVLTSEALEKAYRLERERAKMPRVLIDPQVVSHLGVQEKSLIIKDGDDFILHFATQLVNCQGKNLDDVYSEMCDIKQVRDNAKEANVREKYQWVLDYYYWTVSQIDGIDADRFLPFTSVAKSRFTFVE